MSLWLLFAQPSFSYARIIIFASTTNITLMWSWSFECIMIYLGPKNVIYARAQPETLHRGDMMAEKYWVFWRRKKVIRKVGHDCRITSDRPLREQIRLPFHHDQPAMRLNIIYIDVNPSIITRATCGSSSHNMQTFLRVFVFFLLVQQNCNACWGCNMATWQYACVTFAVRFSIMIG
jgi:hypothetical protein